MVNNTSRCQAMLRVKAAGLCSIFVFFLFLSAGLSAQPNADASLLFSRDPISGTARQAGAGGAFSSVGADVSSMGLNPAGLGLYQTSDICITPGLMIAADRSLYDGNTATGSHTIPQLAQGGAAFTIKSKYASVEKHYLSFKSITLGINFQTQNSFDRSQNFGATNTSNSLAQNYAVVSNLAGSTEWSAESFLFAQAQILGQNASGTYYSTVRAPVIQSGNMSTSGAINNIDLGLGTNFGDKLFFGFSLGIPILNYTVNTQVSETNPNSRDTVTYFNNYQLASVVNEAGEGITGKLGLIYKPSPWARIGMSYSLPTWYFLSENYSSNLIYGFNYMSGDSEIGVSTNPLDYQLRTPMKGTAGASFFWDEHGFISVDYEFQNLGSTHYHFTDPGYSQYDAGYNTYMKTTYGYSHTVRAGIEGSIKKFRIRAGYSFTNSPFRKGQNYSSIPGYDQSVQSVSGGVGLMFKHFYIDAAYVFRYSKDALGNSFQIPLDEINSRYITHNVLLTLGFKIGSKESGGTDKPKRKSSDELPRYIDPGDKY